MIVEHKFLKDYPLSGKKTVIIGTFNPDVACNGAEFFYGRQKNYFWDLLPAVFKEKSLKGDVKKQMLFLQRHEIELTDLILSANMKESDICNYGDDKLRDVIEYNTDNILEILKNGKTEEVYFTRKSFDKSVENIKNEIYKIKDYCEENSIRFSFLPTPSRFLNDKKIQEWKICFGR